MSIITVRDAATQKRFGLTLSYENRLVLILAIVGGISNVDILAFNFLSPFIATDLKLNNSQIGAIGAFGLLSWSTAAIATAIWSDRIGRRRIFIVTALWCFALFSMVTGFVTSFLNLLATRMVIGLAEGPVVPMQNAITHAESSPHRRGINMGIVQNLGSQLLAGLAGPLILVALASRIGWRHAFMIAAIPSLLLAGVVQLWVREPPHDTSKSRQAPLWQTIRAILAVRNIRLCFLIGACSIGWLATMTTFAPLWMVRQLHFAPSDMGLAMACFGAAGTIAAIVVPGWSDIVGRRLALVAFALLGLILPLGLLHGGFSLIIVCLAMFVGSFFTGIMPLFIGIIPMESVDARHGATALAIVMGGAQIAGSFLGPLLGGVLADRLSPAAPLWLLIGFALGAALIGLLLRESAPARRQIQR